MSFHLKIQPIPSHFWASVGIKEGIPSVFWYKTASQWLINTQDSLCHAVFAGHSSRFEKSSKNREVCTCGRMLGWSLSPPESVGRAYGCLTQNKATGVTHQAFSASFSSFGEVFLPLPPSRNSFFSVGNFKSPIFGKVKPIGHSMLSTCLSEPLKVFKLSGQTMLPPPKFFAWAIFLNFFQFLRVKGGNSMLMKY